MREVIDLVGPQFFARDARLALDVDAAIKRNAVFAITPLRDRRLRNAQQPCQFGSTAHDSSRFLQSCFLHVSSTA